MLRTLSKDIVTLKQIAGFLGSSWAGALNFVLPPRCLVCFAPTDQHHGVCPSCWSSLPLISEPYCAVMGVPFSMPMEEGAISPAAIAEAPPFSRARAPVLYEGPAKALVYAFKYADRHECADLMATLMARSGRELFSDADCLIPVPLHWRRYLSRRYNQAEMLALKLGKLSDLPVHCDLMFRKKHTRHQVGLTSKERLKNVSGAFALRDKAHAEIAGKNIVLIDDVFTTGATVNACCRALLRHGAKRIDVLTFARVAPGAEFTV